MKKLEMTKTLGRVHTHTHTHTHTPVFLIKKIKEALLIINEIIKMQIYNQRKILSKKNGGGDA